MTTQVMGPAPNSRVLATATVGHCVAEEDIPDADFLTGGRFAGCAERAVAMTDGQIRGNIRCTEDGTSIHEQVAGKYDASSFEATRRGLFTKANESFSIEVRGRGRRIGACTPTSTGAQSAALLVEPGRWSMTTKAGDVELPDVPPDLANLGAGDGEASSFEFCMTPKMASNPESPAFLGVSGADCVYQQFTMRGGKIAGKGVCKQGAQSAQAVALTGNYAPDRYSLHQTFEQDGGPFVGRMKINVAIDARRVGECTGDEEKLAERETR